jgi:pimeloyl-ACP methyl ester carboxylesterase
VPANSILMTAQANNGMAMKFHVRHYLGVKGVRLLGDVGGNPSAPSVVLLHGGGQTRHSWGGAMRELVMRGYHVVNLDARGHGESEWAPDGDYTLGTMAQDLERVIETLSSRPALVGASMGGCAALILAGTRQQAAGALVLVDIVPRMGPVGASKVRTFMLDHADGFATLEDAAEAVNAYNEHRPRPDDLSGLMKNLRRGLDGRLHWHWDPRLLAGSDGAQLVLPTEQLSRAADHVRVPTLLVRGQRSDIVTDSGVADIRSRIPHIELFDVAGAGHMVAGDQNDVFNQGVFEFLHRHLPV